MRTISEYLPQHPFFAGLSPEAIDLVAGCATNVHLKEGEFAFRAGDPADTFYVLRHGLVAIEVRPPNGDTLVIDTVGDDDVLGWSWLVPPYRWMFDARAVDRTRAVAIDGACLRGKCDADPSLGYALLQRVSRVMYDRLHAARVRMLDLYGPAS